MRQEKAIFAGGCFWCIEAGFEKTPGVISAVSGYTGGSKADPTYEEVSSGKTGHYEAVEVTFDPDKVSYKELLDVFWRQIDPTDSLGQFADKGSQYLTAIFYLDDAQRQAAEDSKKVLERSGYFNKPIATRIIKAEKFYPAEDYHQDYYKKQAAHYEQYKEGSGRGPFIEKFWKGKPPTCSLPSRNLPKTAGVHPDKGELKNKLTPLQFSVTQENATERPFDNAYWDEHREGIYVDVVSGEPLFSSRDKFDSRTGWPSFTRPLEPDNVREQDDSTLGMKRTEVRSSSADSHLGHVFDDGPGPTGQRFCINSAALRFIPKEDLEKEGYGKYKKLFE